MKRRPERISLRGSRKHPLPSTAIWFTNELPNLDAPRDLFRRASGTPYNQLRDGWQFNFLAHRARLCNATH